MAMIPPPEGLSAEDYDAIEAAVVETVRGRWFLAEYTRRSRVDEMRQMLDGLAKLEQTVREQHLPADPSIRLLVQRLKDVSQTLAGLAVDMRADGLEEHYCRDIETQARAVGGLLRSPPQMKVDSPRVAAPRTEIRGEAKPAPLPAPQDQVIDSKNSEWDLREQSAPAFSHPVPAPAAPIARVPELPVRPAPQVPIAPHTEPGALTRLDRLSTAEKVALFS